MLRPAVLPDRGGSNGLAPYSESYTYDPTTGNLASKAGVSYTYDTNHPHAVASLSNGNTYQYDLNGNHVTRNIGSDSYTLIYDAENRLVEVKKNGLTIATFDYDGDGKRVKSVIGGETILFVGRHYEVANGIATKYYFAGDQRVALRKNGMLSYLLGDHLGSTSIATDSSGNKVSEIKYKAWGEVRYASGAWVTDYTYTGQYSNVDDIGLMFYGARWYDPVLGRWSQPDTLVALNTQGVQAWDRFAYVNNSPVNYSDPTGHMMDSGCNTEGCDLTEEDRNENIRKAALWLAANEKYKCQSGNTAHCSGDPLEIFTFVVTGLVTMGILPEIPALIPVASTAGTKGSAIIATACADGDCRNEIGLTGEIGEKFLMQVGGESQVYFSTSWGGRYIDQLINGMAYEAKVGYVSLTDAISKQVAKDVELLMTGKVDSVTWVFFKSPTTGVGGPSEPLYQLLVQNFISVFYVP